MNYGHIIDVKMHGSVLEEKSSFKMLGFTFSSKLDWGSYIISISKTSMKFLSSEFAIVGKRGHTPLF